MAIEFFHVGIPVDEVRPDMWHSKEFGVWATDPDGFEIPTEYILYEEGTPFPDILRHQEHIAFYVDDLEHYLGLADEVIFGPAPAGKDRVAFMVKDGAIYELYEKKRRFR